MTITEVLDYRPLLTDPKFGRESSIRELIHRFYKTHIDDKELAAKYAESYLAQIEDQFHE
jgi:truncated hemoglobin YjbI